VVRASGVLEHLRGLLFGVTHSLLDSVVIYCGRRGKQNRNKLRQKFAGHAMIKSNVKQLMEEKEVTVRRLMELTGLADGTILRARGKLIAKCSLETLASIAAALGVGVKDLFSEEIE